MRTRLMHSLIFACVLLCLGSVSSAASKPFPQHKTYTPGTIQPDIVTQTQMDQATQDFYDYWKSSYLRQHPKISDQYYVLTRPENKGIAGKTHTVSEGHGYGMIFTAIMAGYDANAQTYFNGLYRYFKAHPSINNSYLMAWNQILDSNGDLVDNQNGGNDSATDADMDIAYALLLADQQWGSAGSIDYLSEANNVSAAIMLEEVNQSTWILKLGDWAEDSSPKYGKGMRLSDFMLNHLKAFQAASGNTSWSNVTSKCYKIINSLFQNYSPQKGLMPDFAKKKNGAYRPALPDYLESEFDGKYYWNACRTPWRFTIDYLLSGDTGAYSQLSKLNSWIQSKTGGDPARIRAGYTLSGQKLPEPFDNAMAFVAPFAVSAMIDAANQRWLNSLWTHMTGAAQTGLDYYGDSIKLHSMIIVSGNWYSP